MSDDTARQRVSPTALLIGLLAGPVVWLFDESIALVVNANACSGPAHSTSALTRPTLAGLAMIALLCIAAGTMPLWQVANGHDDTSGCSPIQVERRRFLAMVGLLLGCVTGFGVLLRLVSAIVSPVCA